MSHSCMIICTFTPLYVCITRTPSPHCPSATTHIWTHTHVLSQSHTHKISIKKTRAHLKRPNPNKHELELNSNIWKYCSVKNFSRKKKLSNIRGLFSHTQKGSVDVLRARHGDAPFDRPRGRGSRACTGFRIVVVVLKLVTMGKNIS